MVEHQYLFANVVKDPSNQPALVTCTVNEQHKVVFEIDTGATCNILPFSDYTRATGDKQGIHISSIKPPLQCTITVKQCHWVKCDVICRTRW